MSLAQGAWIDNDDTCKSMRSKCCRFQKPKRQIKICVFKPTREKAFSVAAALCTNREPWATIIYLNLQTRLAHKLNEIIISISKICNRDPSSEQARNRTEQENQTRTYTCKACTVCNSTFICSRYETRRACRRAQGSVARVSLQFLKRRKCKSSSGSKATTAVCQFRICNVSENTSYHASFPQWVCEMVACLRSFKLLNTHVFKWTRNSGATR